MLTKDEILNGGAWEFWEWSYVASNGWGTKTAWKYGRPYLTYTEKSFYAGRAFTQNLAISERFNIPLIDMNALDSAALGDLAELQTDAIRKAGYLNSETATWFNEVAYAGEVTETTGEIDILKTLMSGQTTQPAGTGSQPEGTQPDKAAGLNPLIVVAGVAAVGLAALALRGKA